MKLNKIFLPLVAVATMFGYACTDEVDYTPAEPAPVTEYYFSTVQNYHNDLVDGDTAVIVTIARANSAEAATVNFNIDITPEANFKYPTSVYFPAGVGSTTFKIEFDLNDLEVNVEYKATLEIPGIQDTPYSLGKFELTMLYLPWRDFEKDDSMGLYYEGGFGTLFGDPVSKYPVKVQMHPTNDNIFRIINPYGPGVWPDLEYFGDYDGEDHYMVIDCSNPNQVIVPEFFTGVTMQNFGPISMASSGYLLKLNGKDETYIQNNGYYGTYSADKGIIKNGENSFWNAYLNNGGKIDWYIPKTNVFKLVLPGFEDEPEWEDYGYCNFTDGLLGPWVGELDNTYLVLVQHSLEDKDVYRIVDPYGPNSGYTDEESEAPEYFTFSIADPDFVTIDEVYVGLVLSQKEALYAVTSMADAAINYMNLSPSQAKAAGYGATYKNKVLTLAADNCVGLMLDLPDKKGLYLGQADERCDMVLDMNNPIPVESEEPEANTESRHINVEKVKTLHIRRPVDMKLK